MKYAYYIFLLILVFLLLEYKDGFKVTVTNAGAVIDRILKFLQGR